MINNPVQDYIDARNKRIHGLMDDCDYCIATEKYFEQVVKSDYVRNFTWMGIPILQLPSDLMVLQELIWDIKPDCIIETGVAFGGLSLFCGSVLDKLNHGIVLSVDIEIRPRNYENIVSHPASGRVRLIKGDSVSVGVMDRVRALCGNGKSLVLLDSLHTHSHVLQELRLYSPFVSIGSYIVVFDTTIELYSHSDLNPDRPWGKGNNPYTAVQQFLAEKHDDFIVDKEVETRAGVTAAPGGWLKRIK
jgi:cephalosporin hydroxylase